MNGYGRRVIVAGALLFIAAHGQLAPPAQATAFEVVSVKPLPPDARAMSFAASPLLPGGDFRFDGSLRRLVELAYNVKDGSLLSGLPDWASSAMYHVDAKAPEGSPVLSDAQNRARMRVMLQAMLANRFELSTHWEARPSEMYKMVVADGGVKIRPVDSPSDDVSTGSPVASGLSGGGRILGNAVTASGLASSLAAILGKRVVDETGIGYKFNISLQWEAPSSDTRGAGAATEAPGRPQLGAGLSPDSEAALAVAIRDELGIKLIWTSGPAQFLIVDRAERPTPDQ